MYNVKSVSTAFEELKLKVIIKFKWNLIIKYNVVTAFAPSRDCVLISGLSVRLADIIDPLFCVPFLIIPPSALIGYR